MNKFFLISQVFYPDEVSTANLFTILCEHLAEESVNVEVWTAQPSYTSSDKQPGKLYYKGINIKYLLSTRFHKSNLPGRALNILSFLFSSSIRLLFSRDKSPVFTHTTPPFLGIIISLICRLKNRKFIYIMLDIFPEGLIRLKKMSRKNPVSIIWQKMFIRALKRSDKIIVLGRDMGDYLTNIYTEGKSKIEYIPHWQNENLIQPIDFKDNQFVIEHNLSDHFIVQYSGNMGLWNDMTTIGKAAASNIKGVKFLFIGGGIRKKELLDTLPVNNRNNVKFLPFQPGKKLSESLSACNISIVSLREGLEGIAVPSKIYGILASGVPVIALVPASSEIAYIVNEEKCGYVVEPGDVDGLLNAIIKLKSDEKLRLEMGVNGRKAFENKYTTSKIAEKYKSLIKSL